MRPHRALVHVLKRPTAPSYRTHWACVLVFVAQCAFVVGWLSSGHPSAWVLSKTAAYSYVAFSKVRTKLSELLVATPLVRVHLKRSFPIRFLDKLQAQRELTADCFEESLRIRLKAPQVMFFTLGSAPACLAVTPISSLCWLLPRASLPVRPRTFIVLFLLVDGTWS